MKNSTVITFKMKEFFNLAKGEAFSKESASTRVRGISLKLALEKGDII